MRGEWGRVDITILSVIMNPQAAGISKQICFTKWRRQNGNNTRVKDEIRIIGSSISNDFLRRAPQERRKSCKMK